jgi:hypothetical protein
VELHVVDDLAYFAKTVLEAFVADISVASEGIRVLNGKIFHPVSDAIANRTIVSLQRWSNGRILT